MRNDELRFAMNPTRLDMDRSTFNTPFNVKTSANIGEIFPIFVREILPGDTFEVETNKVVRLSTLLTPIMDNIYLDTYYFFVPNRLVWKHWKELMGENNESAWVPETEYEVPIIKSPATTGWTTGTIADYFGIPTGIPDLEVNALPFRAYAKIMNDWFRDENLSDPLYYPEDETTVTGVNTGTFVTDVAKGGLPYTAAKLFDYFTGCLPQPQKGDSVGIPLSLSLDSEINNAPVYGNGTSLSLKGLSSLGLKTGSFLGCKNSSGYNVMIADSNSVAAGTSGTVLTDLGYSYGIGVAEKADLGEHLENSGLIADLGSAVSIDGQINGTISDLRLCFQLQKLLERDARGGTRYTEILKSHFGVQSPDSRLQRSEYLGGNRLPININTVVQQSGTGEQSITPQGTLTAFSVTTDNHFDFIKSFTEHGFVIGLCVARYKHTYQQGLNRMWTRKTRFDYYWPVLSSISEQPVYNREVYCQGPAEINPDTNKAYDDEVFGYQEAWADYRYIPSMITGQMRTQANTYLDTWHLADYYESLPVLGDTWIREDKNNVDRVLAVTSANTNQLFGDFVVDVKCTRCMPLYSIPGLIDHH